MPWVFKEMENLLEIKCQGNENMENHDSKILKNHLTMYYLSVQDKLKDKRAVVAAHRELMK